MSDTKPVSTSYAHQTEPLKEGKLAESSKTLSDHYAAAKSAQLQKQQPVNQQSSAMSHAKTVQMDSKENKLDVVSENMRAQYARAKSAQIAKSTAAKPTMKAPAPAPGMHLRPGGNLQRQVDGPIHRKELSDYDKHVKSLAESAKARQNVPDKSKNQNNDRDRDR